MNVLYKGKNGDGKRKDCFKAQRQYSGLAAVVLKWKTACLEIDCIFTGCWVQNRSLGCTIMNKGMKKNYVFTVSYIRLIRKAWNILDLET